MSQGQHLEEINLSSSLPTTSGARAKTDPAKGSDLENATAGGPTSGKATNSSVHTSVDEWEKYQRSHALLLGVVVLVAMQIVTHFFTRKLYAEVNKQLDFWQEIRFYFGVLMSVSLLSAGYAARCCCNSSSADVLWKRTIGALAAWTSFCCAVSFATMVRTFPLICSFYSSKGVLGDETIEFTHIDCPRLLGKVPARVVTTLMGHIYAGAAIGVLGGLVVMKPKLSPVIPRIAIDFVDLQDFALLLIDDEILKTFWGQAEGGYGGEWLWWLLFFMCCFAMLSMMAEVIYQYATTSPVTNTSEVSYQEPRWSSIDNIMNVNSLIWIEIPFLVMRMYTSLRFDVPPSSLVLKNICSTGKEAWELYGQRHMSLGFYGSVVGAEDH